ncbi:MAG: peptidoglycan DD-metalloendopeptidase family protein [Bacteroidales bacterium]|nr:peptidoglycan DD-metalloendopeptidase family protein [Bacteroidales bacterium]
MKKEILSIFVLLLLIPLCLSAQDKSALERNKKQLEAEIAFNKKLLKESEKSQKSSATQIVILKNNIDKREKLVNNLHYEIQNIDRSIQQKNGAIEKSQQELTALKDDYAKMIRFARKNQSAYTSLAYVFAADDFNQAFRRMKYLQQISQFRRNQAEKIVNSQENLKKQVADLESTKQKKQQKIEQLELEQQQLAADKTKMDATLAKLRKEGDNLKKEIKKKQQEAANLQKEIERIIAEEIRKAAEKKDTKKTGKQQFALTPAEQALSNDFTANKGKLPWPLERGIISQGFGKRHNPLTNIEENNNGIDLLTDKTSEAQAVFSGVVTKVWQIRGFNNVVMIRHGEYITVYSKLDAVYVKQGDTVKIKQKIGKIHTDVSTGQTELHFELWRGKVMQNPETWLAR